MQEKRLGQAVSPNEQAVEEVIRRVPAWTGKEVHYVPMEGGILNSNWRVSVAALSPATRTSSRYERTRSGCSYSACSASSA